MHLEQFLVSEIFTFLLIFTRIGTGIMLIPGIGESYVAPRFRLLLALMISLAMTPALAAQMPKPPTSALALTALLAMEILVGLFIGFVTRFLVTAMHTIGLIVSYQSSLAAATMFDMTQASQGSAIGNFLSVTAVVFLFTTDMHHLMLQALFESYAIFPAGFSVPINDMANFLARLSGDILILSVKLASPIIVVGLMIYMGSGVLSRLMPNMHVFFVIVPPQILISFMVLMLILSGLFLWYLNFVEESLLHFSGGLA